MTDLLDPPGENLYRKVGVSFYLYFDIKIDILDYNVLIISLLKLKQACKPGF